MNAKGLSIQAIKLLKRAQELLQSSKTAWHKGDYGPWTDYELSQMKNSWCASGALARAAVENGAEYPFSDPAYLEAITALAKLVPIGELPEHYAAGYNILMSAEEAVIVYNDATTTVKAQVVNLFRKAIAAATPKAA